jgi:fatty acid desaturase
MSPDHRPTPATIIGELLTSHPEAGSLLAEASHCRALAKCSGVIARVKFAAAQAARLAYEELRHRLEPRRRHPINFGVGLLLLLVLSAGLAMLVLIELSGWLDGPTAAVPALAATAVWLTVAWLAVLAVLRRHWTLVAVVIGTALLLELLLVALHDLSPHPGGALGSGHDPRSTIFAVLAGVFILMLTASAAVLMAHVESPRLRWHRARAAYEEAAATQQADAEAAAVAVEAWLGLVRIRATTIAADDERLVQDTVALAAVLIERDRPELPPSL